MSKLLVILVLLGMTAMVLCKKHKVKTEVQEHFKKWKGEHKRQYVDDVEEERRMEIFAENVEKIKKMQAEDRPYKVDINKFADLTTEEFATAYLGLKAPSTRTGNEEVVLTATTLPASVDWRTRSAVTPVKNQGQCGSCYTFSSTGALEGLYAIKYGILKSFSEQQILDCSGSYGNYGCNGGSMTASFKYTRDYGIQLGSSYSYLGYKSTCSYSSSNAIFRNVGWVSVTKYDNAQLAAAVAQQPVSAAVEADASVFQWYSGGIIDGSACGTAINHAILIVGYGTDSTGKNYWIVKNSWGTGWGEAGYVRISKTNSTYATGVCGIAKMASYPTV
jgi:C1A family cysteine protease